ncbi:carotenoid biosynthesis protein [Hydrogenophaga pseudoflava]|uniref:carotenoid biosynthesis protein n=1 Tax=Hydrogenophaga pseudoflava TaxID=47421 RepID=UPI0027E58855|nr:carotenoid biosynthesis protein [Hydrogenophaga pseudoflava]MDQ7743498.1 carotenoid biosynthesis protein [Hydrogenophaga pseudoflava]
MPSFLDRAVFQVAAAGTALLLIWTAWHYPPLTLALVVSCAMMFWVCAWSATRLLGYRRTRVLMLLALGLGWFAEQMGSSRGWFFGRYTYTEVLGPRLGDVPLAIPLMWFALALIGYVMASLMLWRRPVHTHASFRSGLLTAWVAAMVITAFDLGADPYFVFVLKAWIMQKTDGGWFGETLQGFAGWMAVSLVIVGSFQALAAPRRSPPPADGLPLAVLVPILIYASGLVFQVLLGHPIEVRAIAFFAMGLPVVVAWAAWRQWSHPQQRAAHARRLAGRDLAAMPMQADPTADDTITALIGRHMGDGVVTQQGTARLAQANQLMAAWTHNAALAPGWASGVQADPEVTAALEAYVAQAQALPDWADPGQIARAEALFMEHGPLSCTLLFCSSLPECYVMPQLAEVLHIAGQLEQHTEHRIRQTAAMVFPVMMKGGLTDPEGAGVAQVLKVRLIHATIRHLILRGDPQKVRGRVPPQVLAGAERHMHSALAAHGWDVDAQGLPCNQIELAYTLLTFSYSFLKGMRTLGLGLPSEDEEAYLHAWNVMGHVLGVRRELMAWTMDEAAVLFEVLQAQAPLLPGQADPRPPLGRALVAAMAHSIRVPVLRGLPVPLTRWLIGPDTAARIGIDGHVSWATRLVFQLGRLLVGVTDGVVGLVWPGFSLSRLFTRAIGYHLLTRFLMNQTRPLALPDRVLNPMGDLIAGWSQDPLAPAWLNRLEDRLTTTGTWHSRPFRGVHATDGAKAG